MKENTVKVRVTQTKEGHKEGEVIRMDWLDALEATGDGWCEYVEEASRAEFVARETR